MDEARRLREKQHARSLASMTKQLEDERERVFTVVDEEREASAAQIRAAQEVTVGGRGGLRFRLCTIRGWL